MIRISHALLIGLFVSFLVAIVAFLGGWSVAQAMGPGSLNTFVVATSDNRPEQAEAPVDAPVSFAVFWEVWGLVQREFYHTEPLDQQEMVYGAIRGMLASLGDEYTVFKEPETAERSRESLRGRFEGIGVYMRVEESQVIVTRPIKDSPAMKAGLQADDRIIAIDSTPVDELIAGLEEGDAINEVSKQIRGPKGTAVTLTVLRAPDQEPFDVEIIRDEVPLISVHWQMLDNNVAYLQITEFKATTIEELQEALREMLPQEPIGLVLDLRNNPGGFLTTSQEVLGHFYDGVALLEEDSAGVSTELYTIDAPSDVRVFELPMVVLINGNSASASEIVAGALRDERPNTLLLGETSFGKGSVQNIHRLSDGSSARITISHWFTPTGGEIHQVGVTPEHIVPFSQEPQYAVPCTELAQPPEGLDTCSDAQLFWGARLLTSDETPPTPEPTPTGLFELGSGVS